eukprot:CAMPEP_0177639012 /NCGR_PEP_ID=MMETSP0447-20121125/5795_1 /TAXON_ID=0 /ORGANISM="Stygamoeba regulata, Strain BSH-02190019" /LENGTH=555 /DNA_ID=CAMNT_0019141013 /DNA_START=715 /DNA_END=2382 /DNA_ORIENTATION=+
MCTDFLEQIAQANSSRYLVYIPDGGSQTALRQGVEGAFPWAIRLANAECRKSVTLTTCVAFMRRCKWVRLSVLLDGLVDDPSIYGDAHVAVPYRVCDVLCQRTRGRCAKVLGDNVDSLPTCASLDSLYLPSLIADVAVITNTTTTTTGGGGGGTNGTVALSPADLLAAGGAAGAMECVGAEDMLRRHRINCGPLFGYADDLDTCTYCMAKLMFTHSKRQAAFIVTFILSIVNIACALYAVIPFLMSANRRRFPVHLPAFFCLATVFLCLLLIQRVSFNVDHQACVDSSHTRGLTTYGKVSGALTNLALHLLMCYWVWASVHLLFMTLAGTNPDFNDKVQSTPVFVVVHASPWILYGVYMAMAYKATWGMNPFGFVFLDAAEEAEFELACIWYSVILGVGSLVSLSACLLVLFHHLKIMMATTSHSGLVDYWRLFVFSVWSSISLAVVIFALWWWYIDFDAIFNGVADFSTCYMSEENGASGCEKDFKEDGLYTYQLVSFILFSTLGLCFSVTYGTSKRSLHFWKAVSRGSLKDAMAETTFLSHTGRVSINSNPIG